MHDRRNFREQAREAGFTDAQVDFMETWLLDAVERLQRTDLGMDD